MSDDHVRASDRRFEICRSALDRGKAASVAFDIHPAARANCREP
jgi:hypothetical protein